MNLLLSPPPPWAANEAPEPAEESSGSAILAGFLLLVGLLILGLVLLFSRRSDSEPEERQALGESATLTEVASQYPLSWSPGPWICWRGGEWWKSAWSPLYAIVWIFLFVWLAMCGIYLIIAGAHVEIEVFRGGRHLAAALLVGLALVLCAVWSATFRLGSYSTAFKEKRQRKLEAQREYQAERGGPAKGEENYAAWSDELPEPSKKHWLAVSAVVLVVAYLLSAAASGVLRAWTLPGEQHGMLLFLAPGYGLFAGWMLFAASLSIGVAIKAWSVPGSECKDERVLNGVEENECVYPDSWQPLVVMIVGGIIACACADPAQMVPSIFALVFFVSWRRRNLYALAAAGVFAIIAAVVVLVERS